MALSNGGITSAKSSGRLTFSGISRGLDVAKSMKLGGGGRFQKLSKELAAKGVRDPGAVAASIGRKKYGAKKMAKMSAAGRKR